MMPLHVCAVCGHIPDDHRFTHWPRKPPIVCDMPGCGCRELGFRAVSVETWLERHLVPAPSNEVGAHGAQEGEGAGHLDRAALGDDHDEGAHDDQPDQDVVRVKPERAR